MAMQTTAPTTCTLGRSNWRKATARPQAASSQCWSLQLGEQWVASAL